jgi:hypothetical protein
VELVLGAPLPSAGGGGLLDRPPAQPGYAEACFEAGAALEQTRAVDKAESVLRTWVAVPLSRDMIRREPENPKWHKFHNELLYRLRHADDLKSCDTAPKTMDRLLSKVFFLSQEKRAVEALDAWPASLRWNPTIAGPPRALPIL